MAAVSARRPRRTTTLWIVTAAIAALSVAALIEGGFGLLLILLQVVFLALHGAWRYGWRAVVVFIVAGLVISNALENLSIQSGFPFGNYHYNLWGKIFQVPWFIGLAYLATGYLAWIVGTVLLGDVHRNSGWPTTVGTPIIGAFAMTAWDLAMDPTRATVNKQWIWENGGGYYGVPLVNFLGWTLTVYLFMQVFALYLRSRGPAASGARAPITGDLQAVLLYAATTLSFFGTYFTADRTTVTDATGRSWRTGDIYETSALLTVYGMLFLAVLALLRLAQRHTQRATAEADAAQAKSERVAA